jgi:murein DD-endopeptidase MepM/ murein hydrolase activator NlpD
VLVAALALALTGGGVAPASTSEHGRWRRPLIAGALAGSFSFDPAAPYAGGRRRGIDLRGRPGAPVLAACGGVVTHAGAVPRMGIGVTIRCGALVATELGLARAAVRRGAAVRAGALVGRLGARGMLRLGARRAARRHGYVDPLVLLDGRAVVPTRAPPAAPPPARRPPPAGVRRTSRPGRDPAAAGASPVSWPAWAGLALVAAGAGGTTLGRRRRRRRSTAASGGALAPR